jgi:UDP-GlcNAc:undecaprenyl-phosphate GlcNAc-1-phosphate transferase
MYLFLISFLFSFIISGLIIRYRSWHLSLSGDNFQDGPQKFHKGITPRIGGLAIVSGYLAATLLCTLLKPMFAKPLTLIMVAAFPVFFAGIIEDLTKRIGVKIRLSTAFLSGLIFLYVFEVSFIRLDIDIFDAAMSYPMVAIFFLMFAIAGLSNAYNIIDGFNGLASMVAIIAATAILYVAFKVNDGLVMTISVVIVGSTFGFFIWNYPRGYIFLGDGGAYLIGFLMAVTSILLIIRNPSISPWFSLMVNAYPIFETIFTIWRRRIHQNRSPTMPDGAHFHSLIYRRLMKWVHHDNGHQYLNNAKTSPYLWILSSIGVIPAVIFWNQTGMLIICSFIFISLYIYIYFRIVTFRTNWLLVLRSTRIKKD